VNVDVVIDRWEAARGGQEGYLSALAGELARRGVAVRVLCRAGSEERDGIAVEALAPPGGGAGGERRFLAAAAARAAEREGPVLAPRLLSFATHVQLHCGLFADALEAERASLAGLRRALFPLGTALNARRRLLARVEREALGGEAKVMVWTEALRRTLIGAGVAAERIAVAPPGVDLDLFSPSGDALDVAAPGAPTAEGRELLLVAHNPRLKGLGQALETLAALRRRGLPARLTVAGRLGAGPFRLRAERLGVAGSVTFAGPLAPAELVARLRRADLLLHPTFLDPCSLACLEAAACGLPVVTTSRNGAAERLAPAGAALVVDDPRDVAGLARAVEEALEPARHAALRAAALALRPALDARGHLDAVLAWLGVS